LDLANYMNSTNTYELGSIDPVVVLESALVNKPEFVKDYLDSELMGNGQFCTNPSILFVPRDEELSRELSRQIVARGSQPFLNRETKELHHSNREKLQSALGIDPIWGSNSHE
jgi:NADP-dependent aldehyde dehydrogenase